MQLVKLPESKLLQFKTDMKYAFRKGSEEGLGIDEEVLHEEDINRSLTAEGAEALVVMENDEMIGGAIVVINKSTGINHLDFLYVKVGFQGQKIGQFLWQEIEKCYPKTKVWETCTPYFDVRNIHFYINCCGFSAVEFYNKMHPETAFPEDNYYGYFAGMFKFQKKMPRKNSFFYYLKR